MKLTTATLIFLYTASITGTAMPTPSEEEAPDNYLGGFFRRGEDVKAPDDYLGGFFKREEDGKAPDNYLGGFFKRGAE